MVSLRFQASHQVPMAAEQPAWAKAMEGNIIEANRKELASIKVKLAKCEEEIGEVRQRQDTMETRLKNLEDGGKSQGNSNGNKFMPTYLDIKGFCDFKETKTKGVTRGQATEILQHLVQALPEELKPHIKDFNLRAARSYGMRVPVIPKFIYEVGTTWKALLAQGENKFGPEKKELLIVIRHLALQHTKSFTPCLYHQLFLGRVLLHVNRAHGASLTGTAFQLSLPLTVYLIIRLSHQLVLQVSGHSYKRRFAWAMDL